MLWFRVQIPVIGGELPGGTPHEREGEGLPGCLDLEPGPLADALEGSSVSRSGRLRNEVSLLRPPSAFIFASLGLSAILR